MAAVMEAPAVLEPEPGKCGRASRQTGDPCRKPAGWGTSHRGFGACSLHGGKTPSGQAHGAKLAAIAAMPTMGGEIDINPLDGLLYTVRRASGLASWYRMHAEARTMAGENPEPYASLERDALGDLAKWAKMAIDAGVAERQVRIAERMGERLSAAFEAALAAMVAAGVAMSGEQRMIAVRAYSADLARQEGGPDVPATATDV